MDFMCDQLADGRTLNAVDSFPREALAIEVDTSLPGLRVTRVLDCIAEQRLFALLYWDSSISICKAPGASVRNIAFVRGLIKVSCVSWTFGRVYSSRSARPCGSVR